MFQGTLRPKRLHKLNNCKKKKTSGKRTVVAVSNPTAVNARINMVPEMANGGRPGPTCDRLHRELSAGVNSPKEMPFLSLPNHDDDDHKLSNKR